MLIDHLTRRLRDRQAQGLRRARRIVETPCSTDLRISTGDGGQRDMISFCSNDYLGLANHPEIRLAIAEGARRWGAGSGASHLISGHLRPHAALESELASWLAPCIPDARAITFSAGYMANVALLTALGDTDATIFADKLNHASLVDGALLARAPLHRFPHRRTDLLAAQLERCTTPVKLIVTDAVFSMDGDIADLPALLALADRFDAWLIADDAHGFGVLGERGRGTLAHFGLSSERLIYMATLGKAVGVAGAFVAAHPTIVDWLVQSARTYIYTTAAPPAVAHAVLASLRLIAGNEGQQRRDRLQSLIDRWKQSVGALLHDCPRLNWTLMPSRTAIQPLVVHENVAAMQLSTGLEERGLWVPAIRPPTIPAGTARLRVSLSAAHDEADVECLVQALAQAAQES